MTAIKRFRRLSMLSWIVAFLGFLLLVVYQGGLFGMVSLRTTHALMIVTGVALCVQYVIRWSNDKILGPLGLADVICVFGPSLIVGVFVP